MKPCLSDSDSVQKMLTFCNSDGNQTETFQNLTMNIPEVNSAYGFKNIYCRWNYNNPDPTKYIKFYYMSTIIKKSDFVFTIDFKLTDGRRFYHNLDQFTFIWESQNIQNFSLHYFSPVEFNEVPFKIIVEYSETIPEKHTIFMIITFIFVFCILCAAFAYKCTIECFKNLQRRNLERKVKVAKIENDKNFNEIINPDIIIMRNREFLKKSFKNEMKPIKLISFNSFKSRNQDIEYYCKICKISFILNDSEIITLECKHVFHYECIKDHLYNTILNPLCPQCNFQVLRRSLSNISDDGNITNNDNSNRTQMKILPSSMSEISSRRNSDA